MRHAKSDWATAAGSDFDRPLSKRGIKDAPVMGDWLAAQGHMPGLIVSSPAKRAKQTTLFVAGQLGYPSRDINWEEHIYEASLDELLTVVEDYSYQSGSFMLVGHNPGLDSLVLYLSRTRPAYTTNGKLMTTAAVAVLDFGDNGISAREHSAELITLMRPRELEK